MASGGTEINTAADELQFQSFSDDKTSNDEETHFTSFPVPATPESYDEEADLLSGAQKGPPSFWTFEYYQSLFDVDTKQVIQRIFGSMVPRPGYMQRCIKSRPDLYGPFWICATLVFTIAISGNIADYLRSEGKEKDIWRYDFHKVSFAATAIYTYALFIPLAIWGLLWYRGSRGNYSLMQIICVYGYSLSIYVPLSIFWLINIGWLQWSLVLLGSILSGSVLLLTFWPTVREDENKKFGYVILCVIFVLHMLLAVGFMTYFFHGTKHKLDFHNIPAHTVTTQESTTVKIKQLPLLGINHGLTDKKPKTDSAVTAPAKQPNVDKVTKNTNEPPPAASKLYAQSNVASSEKAQVAESSKSNPVISHNQKQVDDSPVLKETNASSEKVKKIIVQKNMIVSGARNRSGSEAPAAGATEKIVQSKITR